MAYLPTKLQHHLPVSLSPGEFGDEAIRVTDEAEMEEEEEEGMKEEEGGEIDVGRGVVFGSTLSQKSPIHPMTQMQRKLFPGSLHDCVLLPSQMSKMQSLASSSQLRPL